MTHPGVLCFLSEEQRRLAEEVERQTGAEIRLDPLEVSNNIKSMWLVSTDPKYDEDGDPVDDPDELFYILNTPQKIVLSAEQLEFGDAFPFLLSTEKSGDDLTALLQKMLNCTMLLKRGWHLGTEAEFRDSFEIELLPSSSPTLSEDEELWHEYYESKTEEQNI